jgi:CubicO group peptidase (beta-lactamase class C family)
MGQAICDAAFASVRATFEEVVAGHAGTGAALCIHYHGRAVVDLWGGWADAARTRRWEPDSIVQPYSVSKPLAAVCPLLLVDRGLIDLDAPVQAYWPEFTAAASVAQLLSHQAGVVALWESAPTELFYDWDAMCRVLAVTAPAWAPGSAHGESALFYGHLVGELVRRVDGRSLGRFFREEIAQPHGIDFGFGLSPAEQRRCVELTGLSAEWDAANRLGRPALYEKAIANPPGARQAKVVNGSRWRAAEIPAINGHGSARALARFYQALIDGRILTLDLLRQATTAQTTGIDQVFGDTNSWGFGFGVTPDGFGMAGLGGSYAGASHEGETAGEGFYIVAFVTGSMGTHDRIDRIENAFRDCVGLAPLGP